MPSPWLFDDEIVYLARDAVSSGKTQRQFVRMSEGMPQYNFHHYFCGPEIGELRFVPDRFVDCSVEALWDGWGLPHAAETTQPS